MPKAKRNHTSPQRAQKTPAAIVPGRDEITLPPELAELVASDPATYAMVCRGDCCTPEICDGDVVLVSPAAPLAKGQFIVMWPKTSAIPGIKRLTVNLPDYLRPEKAHPLSEVVGMIEFEQLSPPKRWRGPVDQLSSVHAVIGVIKAKDAIVKRTGHGKVMP